MTHATARLLCRSWVSRAFGVFLFSGMLGASACSSGDTGSGATAGGAPAGPSAGNAGDVGSSAGSAPLLGGASAQGGSADAGQTTAGNPTAGNPTGGMSGIAGAGASGAGMAGGSGSATGGTSAGSAGSGAAGGSAGTGSNPDPNRRHLLLRDEAQSMVSYVDLGNPGSNWHVKAAYGRDMQLVGGGRFMIGTDTGYEERMLANGALVSQVTAFAGTQSAHRLRNGNTILAGANWQGGSGIVLVEVNASAAVQHKLVFPGYSYVRLIRQTPTGTFLVTADTEVFEADASAKIIWRAKLDVPANAHVWQALRVPSGETVVSTGYGASLMILGADGSLHKKITGPASVIPNQFVGFQILQNGDFVVANWVGHSGEVKGVQLLEYDPQGTLVWSYKPNPVSESLSLHHVIVIDGLDPSKLYVDDQTGVLMPVVP